MSSGRCTTTHKTSGKTNAEANFFTILKVKRVIHLYYTFFHIPLQCSIVNKLLIVTYLKSSYDFSYFDPKIKFSYKI